MKVWRQHADLPGTCRVPGTQAASSLPSRSTAGPLGQPYWAVDGWFCKLTRELLFLFESVPTFGSAWAHVPAWWKIFWDACSLIARASASHQEREGTWFISQAFGPPSWTFCCRQGSCGSSKAALHPAVSSTDFSLQPQQLQLGETHSAPAPAALIFSSWTCRAYKKINVVFTWGFVGTFNVSTVVICHERLIGEVVTLCWRAQGCCWNVQLRQHKNGKVGLSLPKSQKLI